MKKKLHVFKEVMARKDNTWMNYLLFKSNNLCRETHNLEYVFTWCRFLYHFFLLLQACWKGHKQRKMYKDRINLLQKNVVSVVKVINCLLLITNI